MTTKCKHFHIFQETNECAECGEIVKEITPKKSTIKFMERYKNSEKSEGYMSGVIDRLLFILEDIFVVFLASFYLFLY